jgi:ABC-type lipoprotein export system ATPase subunit
MPDKAIVELEGVSRRFGVDSPVYALRQVDLTIRPGEWVAVLGPSGSGKSTLLNVIGLLDRPSDGTYRFEGVDVSDLDDRSRAGIRGRSIGFVFQSFHLLSHRTVVENVMVSEIYRNGDRSDRRARALDTLERVGLAHRSEYLPSRLSGGERQRAAIARALLGEPRVLLCDEPTGNLDSITAESVLGLFRDLHADGLTIVMITHDQNVAAPASRRVHIVDGQLSEAA